MRDQAIEWISASILVSAGLFVAVTGTAFVAQTLFMMGLAVLLAIGWNIIGGFAGYVSFGQVSFFGFGAYAAAILIKNFSLPWYAAAIIAAVASVGLALPLGMIMLRLKGIFFALGMFGLARILQIIATSLSVTGGPMGSSLGIAVSPNLSAFVMVAAVALAMSGAYVMMRTRFGLRLFAIRDDAIAAQAAGVHASGVRIVAFCISAGVAAIGGALYVWNVGYLDPASAFNETIELQTILIVLAGGIGTVLGPLIGGVLISLLGTALWANFPTEQKIVLGAITIFVAVLMPGGIMSALRRHGWCRRTPILPPPPALMSVTRAEDPEPAPIEASAVLECSGLGVRFGGLVAVSDVDLVARSCEMLAIIGPNGAGKSTLFNLISAFTRPTAGQVTFGSKNLVGLRPEQLARAGVTRTFQTSRLFPSLTVWETVLLAAGSVHAKDTDAQSETARVLTNVDLCSSWAEYPDTLPPGRQRLLEIARALALRPKVLLLDEAMAGMSAHEIESVHAALRTAMKGGCAVIAIEHVLPAIAPLAARVQVLEFGRTIAVGVPHEVLNNPAVIAAYLGPDQHEAAYAAE